MPSQFELERLSIYWQALDIDTTNQLIQNTTRAVQQAAQSVDKLSRNVGKFLKWQKHNSDSLRIIRLSPCTKLKSA